MAVINPPGFLQNAGATHTAEQFRNWHGLLLAGKGGSTSLIPRGGVNSAMGSQLQVTQTGSPSQAIIVKSGHAAVPGSEASKQGIYSCMNDADVTLSVTAAHATLNRIDSVVFKVQDSAYSGASNTSSLVMVDGTPASSPSSPSLPANCIELARVSVLAASTQVVTGSITDRRTYLASAGGVINCTSSTRPAAATVAAGQLIYETDTTNILKTNDGGTTWTLIDSTAPWTTWVPTWANLTVGSGVVSARQRLMGKSWDYRLKFTMGAGSAIGTTPTFTIPVTPHASWNTDDAIGIGQAVDAVTQTYVMGVFYNTGSIVRCSISASTPFVWGSGDFFDIAWTGMELA